MSRNLFKKKKKEKKLRMKQIQNTNLTSNFTLKKYIYLTMIFGYIRLRLLFFSSRQIVFTWSEILTVKIMKRWRLY